MLPEHVLHEHDTIREAMEAIAGLPPGQRAVMTMRNVRGCDADDGVRRPRSVRGQPARPPAARPVVRAALERHLDG